jgi:superfamily I DNA/RNA helicase/mRNA-degrading endonuclease RelE of RelBE toxin-antitoxin system
MKFLIADTFNDSLDRLTGDEQKLVKLTAFDLQRDPVNPGMQFHKLDRVRDRNFWSVRVGRDIRLIVHKTADSLLLCYVAHHDPAYAWAERRKLETHPSTGAAQFVEIRETVQEILIPKYVETDVSRPVADKRPIFASISDAVLLGYGVPAEWLADVRVADADSLYQLTEHLPAEAAEALLELAIGGKPRVAVPSAQGANPFEHPDALRRFRVMANTEELARALDYPWEKWTVFLHPDQRELVERHHPGPARVAGSAGTGKTIVALHRAAFLARTNPDARVLLTTFNDTLASALVTKRNLLVSSEPRLAERIDVYSLRTIALRLHKLHLGAADLASEDMIRGLLREAAAAVGESRFAQPFLFTEWSHVVDAWQLNSWETYRNVPRLGRRVRLPEPQRRVLWSIFEHVLGQLRQRNLATESMVYGRLAAYFTTGQSPPFDFAVVDEAQDVGVAQLRFLAALAGDRPNGLFFAGDQGQRIFQQPFSWKSLGVDVRGRSKTLRVNYRTSHQIRSQADRLLGPAVMDVDGNSDDRSDTVSVFNGPPPSVKVFDSADEEATAVGAWISELIDAGVRAHEIGVIVRSAGQLERAQQAAQEAEAAFTVLDDGVDIAENTIAISTMHRAKGLEFRAVAVMACDNDVIPLQERMATVGEGGDLQEVYDSERQLLYVACTRARDHLLVASVEPSSEFLEDLLTAD